MTIPSAGGCRGGDDGISYYGEATDASGTIYGLCYSLRTFRYANFE
jgi:hypothetical protein